MYTLLALKFISARAGCLLIFTQIFSLVDSLAIVLRRTGMPGAVIVRMSTREYDSNILQNVNSNRRSTRSIPHITKH